MCFKFINKLAHKLLYINIGTTMHTNPPIHTQLIMLLRYSLCHKLSEGMIKVNKMVFNKITPTEQSPEASLSAHPTLKLLLQLTSDVCKEHSISVLLVHKNKVGVVWIQLIEVAVGSNAFVLDINAHFLHSRKKNKP